MTNDNPIPSYELIETEIGLLPADWRVVKLRSVTKRTQQRDPRRFPNQKFKYLDVSSVDRESLRITQHTDYIGSDAPSRARKVVLKGDVIFATVRPTLRRIAFIDTQFDAEICSTAFCILRADQKYIDHKYLFYTVMQDTFVEELGKIQRVASYPAVTDSNVLEQRVPLPPLSEQKKIAAVLSAVQEAKEKTENVIKAAKELKKSLMKFLFTYGVVPVEEAENVPLQETDFGSVPLNWKIMPLDRGSTVQTGVAKGRRLTGTDIISVPYLRVANVQDGYLNLNEMKHIDIRRSELDRFLLRKGDIVLTEGGDFDKLGRGFIWQGEIPSCVHQNHIFAVRADPRTISPEFLGYMVQSGYAKAYFLSVAHKTTNLACINTIKLKALPVLIPERAEQERIASMLDLVDHKIMMEENKKKVIEELFKTLLHNFMTGKLRVNDLEV